VPKTSVKNHFEGLCVYEIVVFIIIVIGYIEYGSGSYLSGSD